MVSDRYILAKGEAPSGWKNRFDQEVVPAAIDAAAAVEMRLEDIARTVRSRPFAAIACAAAVGIALGMLAGGQNRRAR